MPEADLEIGLHKDGFKYRVEVRFSSPETDAANIDDFVQGEARFEKDDVDVLAQFRGARDLAGLRRPSRPVGLPRPCRSGDVHERPRRGRREELDRGRADPHRALGARASHAQLGETRFTRGFPGPARAASRPGPPLALPLQPRLAQGRKARSRAAARTARGGQPRRAAGRSRRRGRGRSRRRVRRGDVPGPRPTRRPGEAGRGLPREDPGGAPERARRRPAVPRLPRPLRGRRHPALPRGPPRAGGPLLGHGARKPHREPLLASAARGPALVRLLGASAGQPAERAARRGGAPARLGRGTRRPGCPGQRVASRRRDVPEGVPCQDGRVGRPGPRPRRIPPARLPRPRRLVEVRALHAGAQRPDLVHAASGPGARQRLLDPRSDLRERLPAAHRQAREGADGLHPDPGRRADRAPARQHARDRTALGEGERHPGRQPRGGQPAAARPVPRQHAGP